ncbi:MAG: guanylate kinase [Lachnospiraceae bacterium]|jgi:guanylate kinase|nr:guanylate kinase [Lachnospiraceae bacterium]
MGRIYYIMGKSATGKDTIYKELLKRRPDLNVVVPYTTRPVREGEKEGIEYFFKTAAELSYLKTTKKMIELRTYQTVFGPWDYFTMDDGQIDLKGDHTYLIIGTLESYEKMCFYFGKQALEPIYIEVPDGVRLRRALEREKLQKKPNYREVCRRYLADEEDFSDEKLARLNITRRFQNLELEQCLEEIGKAIK